MIKKTFHFLPRLKTETGFYTQKSILKRNNLPTTLCESLSSKKIKKFRKIFSSLSKMKYININNNLNSNNNNNTINSISTNICVNKEDNKTKRNSVININTEAELKLKKFLEKFNIEKKPKKNAEYDLIKGRMFNKLKNYLVLKEQNYNTTFDNNDDYSTLQKQKEFLQQKKYDYLTKNKINIITDIYPKLFNNERSTRRFEDLHVTPEEFLNKNFTKEEVEIMIKNANYFKLNKLPFKNWDLKINFTLKDSLDKEEEKLNQEMKAKSSRTKFKNNLRIKLSDKELSPIKANEEKGKKYIVNIVSEKYIGKKLDLKNEKKNNIPKLNLFNINHSNNASSDKRIKKIKKNFFIINTNKLLYKIPATCSRYEKHSKMDNYSEKRRNFKDFETSSFNKKRNIVRHIEDFEGQKIKKNEFKETQNLLNEIKSNYMKKYHERVTHDNIIKNKIKLNNNLRDKIKRINRNTHYIKLSDNDRILLTERLWK